MNLDFTRQVLGPFPELRRTVISRREGLAPEAMPELGEGRLGRQLERLARDGESMELDEATVDAMSEAWNRLSAEERQRLAEAMRDMTDPFSPRAIFERRVPRRRRSPGTSKIWSGRCG